jgi:Na+-transporting NADH:ubiquinone oxidoreductase subunit NqrD
LVVAAVAQPNVAVITGVAVAAVAALLMELLRQTIPQHIQFPSDLAVVVLQMVRRLQVHPEPPQH